MCKQEATDLQAVLTTNYTVIPTSCLNINTSVRLVSEALQRDGVQYSTE